MGGQRGLEEGKKDQMKGMSAFRLKDICRIITMTTTKVKWGRIHLAQAIEGTITCLSLCARDRRRNRGREGRRERKNAAAVKNDVFSRVGKEGETEARN